MDPRPVPTQGPFSSFIMPLGYSLRFIQDLLREYAADPTVLFRLDAICPFDDILLMNFMAQFLCFYAPYCQGQGEMFFALVCLTYKHLRAYGFERSTRWFQRQGYSDLSIAMINRIELQLVWVYLELLRHRNMPDFRTLGLEALCRCGHYAAWEAQIILSLRDFFPADHHVYQGRIGIRSSRGKRVVVIAAGEQHKMKIDHGEVKREAEIALALLKEGLASPVVKSLETVEKKGVGPDKSVSATALAEFAKERQVMVLQQSTEEFQHYRKHARLQPLSVFGLLANRFKLSEEPGTRDTVRNSAMPPKRCTSVEVEEAVCLFTKKCQSDLFGLMCKLEPQMGKAAFATFESVKLQFSPSCLVFKLKEPSSRLLKLSWAQLGGTAECGQYVTGLEAAELVL